MPDGRWLALGKIGPQRDFMAVIRSFAEPTTF